jgi:hypothetical protein
MLNLFRGVGMPRGNFLILEEIRQPEPWKSRRPGLILKGFCQMRLVDVLSSSQISDRPGDL